MLEIPFPLLCLFIFIFVFSFLCTSYLIIILFCVCPGPVLRAERGDTIRLTFMNNADRNYSIEPHGLHYDKVPQDGEKAASCIATDIKCTTNKNQ